MVDAFRKRLLCNWYCAGITYWTFIVTDDDLPNIPEDVLPIDFFDIFWDMINVGDVITVTSRQPKIAKKLYCTWYKCIDNTSVWRNPEIPEKHVIVARFWEHGRD